MAEEATNISAVKTASDGMVRIAIEKYNELLETIANQKGSISKLNQSLNEARNQPPIVNRTTVIKTPEILASENRAWGNTLISLGAAMLVIGAFRRKAS